MNISIQNQVRIKPDTALLLYRNSGINAAILHQVKDNGELSVGKNLDMATLEEIFRSADGNANLTFLPSNILAMKSDAVIWFEKSRKHKIYFEVTEAKRLKLNELSGREIIWPPLLFMIRNVSLYCWALRSNRRPTPQTELFIAPLTHINEARGNVCLPSGIMLHNGVSPRENMRQVSENFYRGVFGHGTGSMKQIDHPGGHDGFWIEHLETQPKKFPVERLKKTNKKLGDILR